VSRIGAELFSAGAPLENVEGSSDSDYLIAGMRKRLSGCGLKHLMRASIPEFSRASLLVLANKCVSARCCAAVEH
jgi:hypothetical protein